jgi:hypothetical protein
LWDYSTKKAQDFVIDLAKSNEYLKARILNDESSMPKNMIEYFNSQNFIKPKSGFLKENYQKDSKKIETNEENDIDTD